MGRQQKTKAMIVIDEAGASAADNDDKTESQ